ncbi:MAG: LytR C-terminal domain-containing protein [Longimicrobiales bacterium]
MARRAEAVALGALGAIVVAFFASFALGVFGGENSPREPEPIVLRETTPENGGQGARVEVLNAARRPGLARRATAQLREAGFDVVYFGNAPASSPDSSVVLDRVGARDVARRAADELGIRAVRSELDSSLYVDATVIVGVDWRVAEVDVPQGEEKGWLARVRGVLRR